MEIRSLGKTDTGRKRKHNEDAFLCDDDLQLYAVADGVGGHAKGEVASAEAVEQLQIWVLRHRDMIQNYKDDPHPEKIPSLRRMMESAIQSACYMVHSMAEFEPDQKGMSTTMSALLVVGELAIIGQVGDSRVYIHRQETAVQVTEDHTLINYKLKHGLITPQQAIRARGKNVITRAVGHLDYVQVDVFDMDLMPGDSFMLCSDGLHGYLKPGEVAKVMAQPFETAASRFIDLANERGGKDNITVVLFRVV
jgi:serine/threonine protein phosphatase PrpC